ncbi:MAG: T9SS type A sorting domain-containing protein, partial [Calditrichaeota bacterium]|nr:T9SS type A sorting domain-containing protein [Calditrichota bacterium]
QQSRVELHIFNAIGQQVATLIDEPQTAGNYEFSWDANAFASGIYFARLKAGNQVKTQKMILLK